MMRIGSPYKHGYGEAGIGSEYLMMYFELSIYSKRQVYYSVQKCTYINKHVIQEAKQHLVVISESM